jgi:hypothetical protein
MIQIHSSVAVVYLCDQEISWNLYQIHILALNDLKLSWYMNPINPLSRSPTSMLS